METISSLIKEAWWKTEALFSLPDGIYIIVDFEQFE